MNKGIFWFVAFVALLLVVLGIFAFDVPWTDDIPKSVTRDWYTGATTWSVIAGLLLGAGAGVWLRRMPYQLGESGEGFLGRAAGAAILYAQVIGSALIVLVLVAIAAGANQSELAYLQTTDRILFLLLHPKIMLPLGAGIVAASLACALATLVGTWGGQYALSPIPAHRPLEV